MSVYKSKTLRIVQATNRDTVSRNVAFVNPKNIEASEPTFLEINGITLLAAADPAFDESSVALNSAQRKTCRVSADSTLEIKYIRPLESGFNLGSVSIEIDKAVKTKTVEEYDATEICTQITSLYAGHILSVGQEWFMEFQGTLFLLKVIALETMSEDLAAGHAASGGSGSSSSGGLSGLASRGMFIKTTAVLLSKNSTSTIKLKNIAKRSANALFRPNFAFEDMGIGGLDTEFSDIFRRAFASRIFPPAVVRKLGINHVKGILLYGPPGCGKTLMARQIGKMLNCKEPKVVNGPSILDKYVGESEKNIRLLFEDAMQDQETKGDDSELHLIVFDEIDAICRQRGSTRDGTGVHDSIVNQLLSMIDGVNALNNVLIIGMTNRKDLIDEALLRPGRFEVQIEVNLPDETGRNQILKIHTKSLRENKALSEDVDLPSIALCTKNFSGAELEGLVKSAASFAFNRKVDPKKLNKQVEAEDVAVAMDDFREALKEVKPAFGVNTDQFDVILADPIVDYGPGYHHIVRTCQSFSRQVATSERTRLLSVLLEGPMGTGKTTLAARVAKDGGFPYAKIISPENMVGYGEASKASMIAKAFDDAYKSPLSVLILDSIERLIEYVHIGPRFSNVVLQTILVLLKKVPPKGRRLLVIGTTSCASVLESMEIVESFNVSLHVPNLSNRVEFANALRESNIFSPEELEVALDQMPTEIGIKKLLQVIEMARGDSGDRVTADRFVECLRDCGAL